MTEKRMLVTVEERTVVNVCLRVMKPSRERERASHAVSMPPLEPPASTHWKSLKLGGKKERAFWFVVEESLVSCKQMIVGCAEVNASLTTSHFKESPSPRTFQESK